MFSSYICSVKSVVVFGLHCSLKDVAVFGIINMQLGQSHVTHIFSYDGLCCLKRFDFGLVFIKIVRIQFC